MVKGASLHSHYPHKCARVATGRYRHHKAEQWVFLTMLARARAGMEPAAKSLRVFLLQGFGLKANLRPKSKPSSGLCATIQHPVTVTNPCMNFPQIVTATPCHGTSTLGSFRACPANCCVCHLFRPCGCSRLYLLFLLFRCCSCCCNNCCYRLFHLLKRAVA